MANGREWKPFTYAGYASGGGYHHLVGQEGSHSIRISYHGQAYGKHFWSKQGVTCSYILDGGRETFQHLYGEASVSPGSLDIEFPQENNPSENFLGIFHVSKSGYLDLRGEGNYTVGDLRGVIRIDPIK